MNQANRTLVILAGFTVLAIVAGLYAFRIDKTDKTEAKQKDRDTRLFEPLKVDEALPDGGGAKAEFTKVTVTSNGETTVLTREVGKEWQVISPVKAGADKIVIDQVVSQLQQAKFKQVIDDKPDTDALVRYGLQPPKFAVAAEAVVGDHGEVRTVKLEGGIENTFDGTVYLRRSGETQVWSAEGGVRWALQKSTFDLREKTTMSFDDAKVVKVEVKTKNNAYTLERDAQKAWMITQPFTAAADQATLAGMLGTLKNERALSFPADTPEARKEFDAPQVDATFTVEGGGTFRIRMVKHGTNEWALREEGSVGVLAEFQATIAGQLDRNPNDLKDRLVLPFKKELVAKIVFHQPDAKDLVVERPAGADGGTGEAWKVTAPEAGPAKTFKVASVMWTLGALKVASLGEENPKDWGKFGIDSRSRTVTLSGYDGKELAKLVVGKDVPGKLATSYVRGARNQVVEVDNSRLVDLPATLADLLDAPTDAGK